MVTSGWAQASWSTTLLPHHQPIRTKSHTLQPLPQILPMKTFPPKPLRSLGILTMSHLLLLVWVCNEPSLAQDSDISFFFLFGLPVYQAHKFVLDNTVLVGKWLYVGPVISVMSLLTDLCERKIFPAIPINKKCHSHQQFLASQCEWGFPKHWSSRCHPPSQQWLLRTWGNARSKVNKETRLVPESWGTYERNEFSEPRGLHLPIHRMLNSLTWYLIFDDQTACPLCCKLVYSLTSPLPPWSSFFRATESLGLGDSETPKHYHQIK